MNSSFWGSGGMFEQALANKMALQDSQRIENLSTAGLRDSMVGVDRQNADTTRLRSDREYDLGLRKNTLEQGQLGVNQSLANTSQFNAETQRLGGAGGVPVAADEANNLGLRTFNPISGSAFNDFVQARNAAIPSVGASVLRPRQSALGTATNEKPELRDGGVVMKPKMVKQPGYMNGGKVKMPSGYKNGGMVDGGYMHGGKVKMKGYRKGGKIGDEAKDDGTDKVEVMAREGEYFLNPETVATAFGGGDYSAGVRNLNQIVRGSTGKEPGPTPVGKSGKQGLNRGGYIDDFGNLINALDLSTPRSVVDARFDPRNEPTYLRQTYDTPAGNAGGAGSTSGSTGSTAGARPSTASTANPNVVNGVSREGQAYNAARAAMSQPAAQNVGMVGRAANAVSGVLDTPVSDVLRKGADIAGKAGGAVKGAVSGPVGQLVGKVALPAAVGMQAMETASTPTQEYYDRTGIDPVATHVPQIVKDMGVRALGTLQDIGNTATFGLADGLGNLLAGNGFTRSSQYQPKGAAAPAAAETPTDKPSSPAAAAKPEVAKEPSLRDMMLARLGGIDSYTGPFGSMVQRGMQGERALLIKELSDMEKAGATNAKSVQAAMAKQVEDTEKYLGERLKSPKTDKDGNITGYFEDPTKLAAFKDYVANLTEGDGKTPFNFVMRDRTTQDRVLEDFSRKYEMTKRFNDRFGSESGGQPVSAMPRVGQQGLRYAIDPGTNKIREMGIGDVFNEGVSLGDYLTSFGPNKIEKRLVFDPVTQKMVAARHVVGTDADIDAQLIGTGQQFGSGLRKQPK